MTVSEAALADICQHPEDDTTRLIYADWLKEHDAWTWDTVLGHVLHHPQADGLRLLAAHWLDELGDPERAEFIRVQCVRTGMDPYHLSCTGDKCGLPECNRLRRRERELFANGDARGPVPLLMSGRTRLIPDRTVLEVLEIPPGGQAPLGHPVLRFVWSRGFVEEVSLTTEDFLRHAHSLFRAAPIQRVTLSDRKPHLAFDRWHWFPRDGQFNLMDSSLPMGLYALCCGPHDTQESALSALRAAALVWGRRQAWPCPECCRGNILTEQGDEDCPDCHGTGHDVST